MVKEHAEHMMGDKDKDMDNSNISPLFALERCFDYQSFEKFKINNIDQR